jgi:hypothetical protein
MKMKILKGLLLILAVSLLISGPAIKAEAGEFCLSAGYTYRITYTEHGGGWDITGYINNAGDPIPFAGSADVVDGDIIIGLTTIWPWGTGFYIDPTSVVHINYSDGTYDSTYIPGNRNFTGTISVVPCTAEAASPVQGENAK